MCHTRVQSTLSYSQHFVEGIIYQILQAFQKIFLFL